MFLFIFAPLVVCLINNNNNNNNSGARVTDAPLYTMSASVSEPVSRKAKYSDRDLGHAPALPFDSPNEVKSIRCLSEQVSSWERNDQSQGADVSHTARG